MKLNTFFKIEGPINLYHAEQHNTKRAKHGSFPPWAHVSICKLPREPFSIYGGKETMHLLMTTYRQDIMTNFGCVCNRSTVTYLPMFQGSFTKHTQACLSTNIFMLKIAILLQYCSNLIIKVILNFQWFWYKSQLYIMYVFDSYMLILCKLIVSPSIHEDLCEIIS